MQPIANVLDLSHHNDPRVPDFAALMRAPFNVLAVILKASQGAHNVDQTVALRWPAADTAGMPCGFYHFLDASNAEDQAAHFLDTTAAARAVMPRLLCADYEKLPADQGGTPGLHQLMTFISMVEKEAGGSVAVYSSDLIRETLTPPRGGQVHPDMTGAADFFQSRRLWLAEYGPHENIPWPWNTPAPGDQAATPPGVWLWQFADHGRFAPLLTGQVDCDFFDGTRDQLAARWVS